MMIKTGIEVAQENTVFYYVPPRSQKDVNSQYIAIVEGLGVNRATNCFS